MREDTVRTANRERGATIIELMVALTILLVSVAGFWSAIVQAMTSTGVANRRTVQSWLRADLVDRVSLTKRSSLTPTPPNTWIIEQCYDTVGRPTAFNAAYLEDFACAPTDAYRRWISVAPDIQQVNEYGFAGPIWRVSVYVENIANGCTPETRFKVLGCTAIDYYLTD
jgi:Tfp pilus assembly protein PilV